MPVPWGGPQTWRGQSVAELALRRYRSIMLKLDRIDFRILRALSVDGRMTKAALAEKVGLSPSPCWERLRRLEASGLIAGYHAEINLRKLPGAVTVFVTIEIRMPWRGFNPLRTRSASTLKLSVVGQ